MPENANGAGMKFCYECGEQIRKKAEICPHCGVRVAPVPKTGNRIRGMAIVLALLLGGLGIHKFYLGRMLTGFLYFLFSWTFIPALLGLLDAVLLLGMSEGAFDRAYNGAPAAVVAAPEQETFDEKQCIACGKAHTTRPERCPDCNKRHRSFQDIVTVSALAAFAGVVFLVVIPALEPKAPPPPAKPEAPVIVGDPEWAISLCMKQVNLRLDSPEKAAFPESTPVGACHSTAEPWCMFESYVDDMNAGGAVRRREWKCNLDVNGPKDMALTGFTIQQ